MRLLARSRWASRESLPMESGSSKMWFYEQETIKRCDEVLLGGVWYMGEIEVSQLMHLAQGFGERHELVVCEVERVQVGKLTEYAIPLLRWVGEEVM